MKINRVQIENEWHSQNSDLHWCAKNKCYLTILEDDLSLELSIPSADVV